MARINGGKTVYGATLGILMLETRFPRPPGDIGHAATWPFPVQYRVVRGATPEKAVLQDATALTPHFIDAARDLVAMGCDGIATNCGFLSVMQDDIAEAIGVPVASSSLMQVAAVAAMLPKPLRPGILTISAQTLTDKHLRAAGVPQGTPIVGTESGTVFTQDILGNADTLDPDACRADLLDAAHRLTAHGDIGAIVLECTNMVPWAADIRRATGLPVWSIYTYLSWFQAALLPRRFAPDLDDPRYG